MSRAWEQIAARRVGTTIGKYHVERVLGVGGMAAVYLGVHRNGHRAALKVLHDVLAADEELRARFVREAYTANGIEHLGVPRVLDDDQTEDGSVYLVMELVEGQALDQRVADAGPLSPAEVVSLSADLLDVLAAAHARGVVHRDVKPANLMLTDGGELRVLDFGIARVRDGDAGAATTQTGHAIGTPAFMPPEQALGKSDSIDARTDVWAVGATMVFLLTGRYVHDPEGKTAMQVAAATQRAPSLARLAKDVPAELVAIVDKALAFEREDRWADAESMRDALDGLGARLFPNRGARGISPLAASTPRRRSPRSSGPRSAKDGAAFGVIDLHLPTGIHAPRGSDAPTLDSPGARVTEPTLRSEDPKLVSERTNDAVRTIASRRPEDADLDTRTTDMTELALGAPEHSPSRPDDDGQSAPPAPLSTAPPRAARSSQPDAPTPLATAPGLTTPAMAPPARLLGYALLVGALSLGFAAFRGARAPAPPASASGDPSISSVALPVASCGGGSECAARLGGPALCRAGVCRSLAHPRCKVLAEPEDLANDATVYIGAMYSDEDSFRAADLARRDFAEVASGLPPLTQGGPRRPLAIVACDDTEHAEERARFLVEDVGVPVVIGFTSSKEALDLATSVFQPRRVLALAGNQSTMLTSLPRPAGQSRVLFRVSPSAAHFAQVMIALSEQVVESRVRGHEPRVALTRVDNNTGVSYADLIVSHLTVRGKPVSQIGDRFTQIAVRNKDEQKAVLELIAARPDIVFRTGGDTLMEQAERTWPKGQPRPIWIDLGQISRSVAAGFAPFEGIESRYFGVDIRVGQSAMAKFLARRSEVYTPTFVGAETEAFPYDSVYLAAYLLAAAGGGPTDAGSLVGLLPRLTSGPKVDVGAGNIFAVFDALAKGGSVDLAGANSTLDFDRETGDAAVDLSVHCLRRDPAATVKPAPLVPMESQLGLPAGASALVGKLDCPR